MPERMQKNVTLVLLVTVLAVGCQPSGGSDTSDDPHSYCRVIGTVDEPDRAEVSPVMEQRIADGLQAALEMAEPLPEGSYAWRCMNGELWGCFVGANLNCGKANTDTTPTGAMNDYCSENPGSDFIPMFITGHDTVWEWKCDASVPVTGRRLSEVDERGYQASNWHLLAPTMGQLFEDQS